MRGTRGYELRNGHSARRPAVEGIRIAGQDVKYERGSTVYLTAQFGGASRAVPVNPARLDGDFLYEGRIGYRNGGNKRVQNIGSQSYGPAAIEALIASIVPSLEEGQILCVRPHSKKPQITEREARAKGRRRTELGVLD